MSPVVVAADGLELAARAWPALRTATVVAAAAAVVVASPSYLDQLLRLRSQDSGIPDRKEAISDSRSFVGCRLQDAQKAKICYRCDRVGVHLQQERD